MRVWLITYQDTQAIVCGPYDYAAAVAVAMRQMAPDGWAVSEVGAEEVTEPTIILRELDD